MYFQVEVGYYSNEAKKNNANYKIYKFSVNSINKKQLKVAEDQIVQGIVLATTTCHTLFLRFESTLLLGLVT